MNIFSDLKLLIITLSAFSGLNLVLTIANDHIRPAQLGGFDNTGISALLPEQLLNLVGRYSEFTDRISSFFCESLTTFFNSVMTSVLALM